MELIYFITFTRVTASNKPRTFRNIHLVADVEHRRIRSERWFERCCKKRFYSSVKALHSRQNIGPPKMFVSWSLNLWIYHRPWQGVIKVEAGIKIANYLTFIWRNYPGLSGWAQCNHKGPLSGRRRQVRGDKRGGSVRRTPPNLAGFAEVGGRWPWAEQCRGRVDSRSCRRQWNALFLRGSSRNTALLTAWLQTSEIHLRYPNPSTMG